MASQLTIRPAAVCPVARMGSPSTSAARCASAPLSRPSLRVAFTRGRPAVARRSSLKTLALTDATEASFETDVLKSDLPVLVDFWATWCGPCKLVAPSMLWADKEFAGSLKVVKIDCTDANKALMEKYKVYGLPCLMIFKDGEKVEASHREGAITKKDLAKYLETHVGVTAAV